MSHLKIESSYDLLEFDRYSQAPNEAIAMRFRLAVLDEKLFGGQLSFTVPAQTRTWKPRSMTGEGRSTNPPWGALLRSDLA